MGKSWFYINTLMKPQALKKNNDGSSDLNNSKQCQLREEERAAKERCWYPAPCWVPRIQGMTGIALQQSNFSPSIGCFSKTLNIFLKNFGTPDHMSNFSMNWIKKVGPNSQLLYMVQK